MNPSGVRLTISQAPSGSSAILPPYARTKPTSSSCRVWGRGVGVGAVAVGWYGDPTAQVYNSCRRDRQGATRLLPPSHGPLTHGKFHVYTVDRIAASRHNIDKRCSPGSPCSSPRRSLQSFPSAPAKSTSARNGDQREEGGGKSGRQGKGRCQGILNIGTPRSARGQIGEDTSAFCDRIKNIHLVRNN